MSFEIKEFEIKNIVGKGKFIRKGKSVVHLNLFQLYKVFDKFRLEEFIFDCYYNPDDFPGLILYSLKRPDDLEDFLKLVESNELVRNLKEYIESCL